MKKLKDYLRIYSIISQIILLITFSSCGNNSIHDINAPTDFYIDKVERIYYKSKNYSKIKLSGFYFSNETVTRETLITNSHNYNKNDFIQEIYDEYKLVNPDENEVLEVRANFNSYQIFRMQPVNKNIILSSLKNKESNSSSVTISFIIAIAISAIIAFSADVADNPKYFKKLIKKNNTSSPSFSNKVKLSKNSKNLIKNIKQDLIKSGYKEDIIDEVLKNEEYLLEE